MIIKEFSVDKLLVKAFDNRTNMGVCVAKEFAEYTKNLLEEKLFVNIIFAAAPSQSDFLNALKEEKGIDWGRINVFHMDEYVGIGIKQPQSFAKFVKDLVVDEFKPGKYFHIKGDACSINCECKRYTKLLQKYPTDIVCLGIGENGHIAFNDPGVADFWDKHWVKKVKLDQTCRNQQVNDKCFESIDNVPEYALTLTVPTLMRASAMFCTVPASTKAEAVKRMLEGTIDANCPATALRTHDFARLYLDSDSAKFVL